MIVIFCGVPGTGKSTASKLVREGLESEEKDCRLFVSDKVSTPVYDKAARFLRENSEADFLILDATFYKEEHRRKIRELADGHEIFIVYLHCDLETCIARNKKRENPVPEKAIYIIASEMEKPEDYDLDINTEEMDPEDVSEEIIEKLLGVEEDKSALDKGG